MSLKERSQSDTANDIDATVRALRFDWQQTTGGKHEVKRAAQHIAQIINFTVTWSRVFEAPLAQE